MIMEPKSNILRNLYLNGVINWEYLETIPEFAKLGECQQNPKWHSEGTALQHTKLAYDKLMSEVFKDTDEIFYEFDSCEDLMILCAAVVLHDIGKGATTTLGKDGKWHAYGHEIEGEKIARVLLWDEDITIREMICSIIRYHMEPLRIFESKNWVSKMIEIGARIPWKFVYYVKMADLLGSIQENGGTVKEDLMKLDLIKTAAKTLNIWHKQYPPHDYQNIVKYLSTREYFPWKTNHNETSPIAVVMIGLPGAGKNTWIDNHIEEYPNAVQISRDDIRVELGFCEPGEKYLGDANEETQVTELYNKKLENAINEKRNIILNNVHLKKKYREATINVLRKAGYFIEYVYVEAPTLEENYKRRDNQIIPNRIKAMALSFEWPDTCEYDKLTIHKQ